MANDSQRGYLSGIVQRGARTVSPDAPAAPVRPFQPTLAPTVDPTVNSSPFPIGSDLPNEIETFIEPAPFQKSFDGDRVVEQSKIAKRILSQDSTTESTSTTPPAESPEPRESAAPDIHPVLPAILPAASETLRSQSPTGLDVTAPERDQRSERLPRLISFSTESLRGNSIDQALRTNDQIGDLQAAEDSSSSQITQSGSVLRVVSHQAASSANSVNSIDDRSPKVKQIESSEVEVTSLVTRDQQISPVVLQQFQLPEQYASTPVAADAGGTNDQLPESLALRETIIETEREVIVVQTLPEQREPSVTWSPSPAPRDEFSMARQQLPPQRQESPKLTINRLDVQIVNQSGPPVMPLPPPPAPARRPDGWNNLERYHLGHLDLIL